MVWVLAIEFGVAQMRLMLAVAVAVDTAVNVVVGVVLIGVVLVVGVPTHLVWWLRCVLRDSGTQIN